MDRRAAVDQMWRWAFAAAVVGIMILPEHVKAQDFDSCQKRAELIWYGNDTQGLTPQQIQDWLYVGVVHGMDPTFDRMQFPTLTLGGCMALCANPTDWYWSKNISLSLGIISNWVLPIIALLAALPYDSLHARNANAPWYEGRVARTLGALLNWIGSPQTALTATLFNIHQIRKCFHATLPSNSGVSADPTLQPLKRDAYYTLSAIGQFKLENPSKPDEYFLRTLAYGLFSPLTPANGAGQGDHARAQEMTKELLQQIAFQLRMYRRRGVYPALLSTFIFFIAYAVSLVLAFGDVGERITAHSLALGILVSWLPLMVMFTILDRNPVSAERSKKIIARWLWNVDSVRCWAESQGAPNAKREPYWWTREREDDLRAFKRKQRNLDAQRTRNSTSTDQDIELGGLDDPQPAGYLFDECLLDFIGQGREMEYCGLTYAMLVSVYDSYGPDRDIRPSTRIAEKTIERLKGHRPVAWRVMSLVSLGLVWLDIGMAFMVSFNTPTVGFGCRTGSYIVYGILSTLTWMVHSLPGFKHPGFYKKAACHVINLLSVVVFFFILFAQFSGVFNDCVCKAGLSGYMDFEGADFYRAHFNVATWWRAGAIAGALPVLGSLWAAVVLLARLKPLWQASEQQSPPAQSGNTDTEWLR